MKIAFLYSKWTIGPRPIDESRMLTSPRGLTGSEMSCYMYCEHMKKRGHDARIFWGTEPVGTFDVAYAFIDPEPMRNVRARLRMLSQQCNDFLYCRPNFDSFVDVYTSPSAIHRDFLLSVHPQPNPAKWAVLPNGCDPSIYDRTAKVPGRVLYASSPDRGLHRLLEAWPEIKRRVPHAHLRILYELKSWLKTMVSNTYPDAGIQECSSRAKYIELAIARMQHLDVTAVGSVSRNDMVREMSEAEVLAYPCDTIRFTEGYSVTTLEACAAGAVPVIFGVDALPEIYGELPTCLQPGDTTAFINRVCDALNWPGLAAEWRDIGYEIASRAAWPVLAERLERMILKRLNERSGTDARA